MKQIVFGRVYFAVDAGRRIRQYDGRHPRYKQHHKRTQVIDDIFDAVGNGPATEIVGNASARQNLRQKCYGNGKRGPADRQSYHRTYNQ